MSPEAPLYVDAVRILANAFSVHLMVGTSTPEGEIAAGHRLTMSREFAEHLVEALQAALTAEPPSP
jgi:hypothetical protein